MKQRPSRQSSVLAEVDDIARLTAGLALVVSVAAVFWARAQAVAQRAAVAPKVSVTEAHSGEFGTVTFTFESNLKIDSATIRVRPDSLVSRIGHATLGAEPTLTTVKVTEVPSKGTVQLPATFRFKVERYSIARFEVRMRGHGFGRVIVNTDTDPKPGFFVY